MLVPKFYLPPFYKYRASWTAPPPPPPPKSFYTFREQRYMLHSLRQAVQSQFYFPQNYTYSSLIQPTNGLIHKFSLYPTYVLALIWPSSGVTCYVHFTYHHPFGTAVQLLLSVLLLYTGKIYTLNTLHKIIVDNSAKWTVMSEVYIASYP
jgi:hypothetical protein